MKALIVEDDLTSRLLLQTFLSRFGQCRTAVNGKEALDAFQMATQQGAPYDLICMDIMMPEIDGKEAVKYLRAIEEERGILSNHGVKIIMTTGVNDTREMFRSFQVLCDAYLTKPIDTAQLFAHLKSYQLVA